MCYKIGNTQINLSSIFKTLRFRRLRINYFSNPLFHYELKRILTLLALIRTLLPRSERSLFEGRNYTWNSLEAHRSADVYFYLNQILCWIFIFAYCAVTKHIIECDECHLYTYIPTPLYFNADTFLS